MLTEKQVKWLHHYQEGDSATEAAMKAYETEDRKTAATIGSKNLHHPQLKKILDKTTETLHDKFRQEAEKAFLTILSIIDSPKVSPKTKLEACKDILDRAGYNPTQKQELIGHVTFEAKAIETAKRARMLVTSTPTLLLEESVIDVEPEDEE